MRKLLLILFITFANNGLVIASPFDDAKAAYEKKDFIEAAKIFKL
jgi:hypothetical protein